MGYTSRICWGTPSRTPDEGSLLGYPSQTPHQYRERSYLARGICWGTDSGYVGYIQPDSGYVGIHPSRLQTRDTLGYTQPYQGIVGVHPSRPGLWWGTTTGPGFCCCTTTRCGCYWGTTTIRGFYWDTGYTDQIRVLLGYINQTRVLSPTRSAPNQTRTL